jgi:hypothetical protein
MFAYSVAEIMSSVLFFEVKRKQVHRYCGHLLAYYISPGLQFVTTVEKFVE